MLPVVFIVGIVFGVNIAESITLSQDTVSSWVSASATVSIAALTFVLAKETWALRLLQLEQMERIRRDAIKPSVNLYLQSNPAGMNFMEVHILNSGPGAARNVRFSFENAAPVMQEDYEEMLKPFYGLTMLKRGISTLSPGEHRASFVFSFIDFYQRFGEKSFDFLAEVKVTFEDADGTPYLSHSFLDFKEYKGLMGGGHPLFEILREIEKIRKHIDNFSHGIERLKADVYTSDDREKEMEERKRRVGKGA
jgi:hypothetical protein